MYTHWWQDKTPQQQFISYLKQKGQKCIVVQMARILIPAQATCKPLIPVPKAFMHVGQVLFHITSLFALDIISSISGIKKRKNSFFLHSSNKLIFEFSNFIN